MLLKALTTGALGLLVCATAGANLSPNTSFELFERLQQMEEKVQSLNGQVEELHHRVHVLQQRQTAQFKDIDTRLAGLQPTQTAKTQAGGRGQVNTASVAAAAQRQGNSDVTAANTPAASSAPADKQAYQQAYQLVKAKRFGQASQAMSVFLKTYPDSRYVANAHYWRGELDLVAGDINAAIEQFEKIVTAYPKHNKVPDALLKLGYIFDDIGQFAKATQYLTQLRQRFPDTTAAQLAAVRLKHINNA